MNLLRARAVLDLYRDSMPADYGDDAEDRTLTPAGDLASDLLHLVRVEFGQEGLDVVIDRMEVNLNDEPSGPDDNDKYRVYAALHLGDPGLADVWIADP